MIAESEISNDLAAGLLKLRPELAHARNLVLAHGWNSTSYQILNPGIACWFGGEALAGYVSANRVRVTVGAPVCALENLPETVANYEMDASRNKERVCYFAAEARLESICSETDNHAKFLIGAQPVWNPGDWPDLIGKYKSLRAQLNRARNKGVTVSEWPREKAHESPQLAECLQRWLRAKGLPPLHFMVEPDTLGRLFDRRVFVAEREGEVVGFVVLSPVATRNGWLFEQFPHIPGAPNGTVELMIDTAMRALAKDGYEYATLGLSPLSVRADVPPFDNPLWLRVILAWLRKHGQRFYNFDGLDAFKSKLQPSHWEPVFALSNEKKISPRTLYAIASAFSENAPIKLLFGGIGKAVVTEFRWLRQKLG